MRGLVSDCFHTGWPPFLIMATALLPLLWPLWWARRACQLAQARSYAVHLSAAGVVGGLLWWMLWPFLFDDELQHGSTASFIFVVAPIYAGMALLATYALGAGVVRVFLKDREWAVIPTWAKRLWWLPAALAALVLLGIALVLAQLLRLELPAKATHPATFRWLASAPDLLAPPQKWTAHRMAGNPNAPADVLAQLSLHGQAAVRLRVATHEHTDAAVLTRLSQDCALQVRQVAQQRLGLPLSESGASAPPLVPTMPCPQPILPSS